MTDNTTAINSATTIDNHTPFISQTRGRSITAAHWKTRVRRNEIIADVTPSLSAVKKPSTTPKIDVKIIIAIDGSVNLRSFFGIKMV